MSDLNLIQNGNFSNNNLNNWTKIYTDPSSNINPFFLTASNSYCLRLQNMPSTLSSIISQSFNTISGSTYVVSYDARVIWSPATQAVGATTRRASVQPYITDSSNNSIIYSVTSDPNNTAIFNTSSSTATNTFVTMNGTFSVTGTNTILTFNVYNTQPNNNIIDIDNVIVTLVTTETTGPTGSTDASGPTGSTDASGPSGPTETTDASGPTGSTSGTTNQQTTNQQPTNQYTNNEVPTVTQPFLRFGRGSNSYGNFWYGNSTNFPGFLYKKNVGVGGRRSTKMNPGGNITCNSSTYIYNKYKPGTGGIGASSTSNRRAKNRGATVCTNSVTNCGSFYQYLGRYDNYTGNPNGYFPYPPPPPQNI